MSQNSRVLDYMQRHRSITPHDAIMHLQCYRLAGRIYDLREKGHHIVNTEPSGIGKHARYVLMKAAP